jgi:hypothetical protein
VKPPVVTNGGKRNAVGAPFVTAAPTRSSLVLDCTSCSVALAVKLSDKLAPSIVSVAIGLAV